MYIRERRVFWFTCFHCRRFTPAGEAMEQGLRESLLSIPMGHMLIQRDRDHPKKDPQVLAAKFVSVSILLFSAIN